MIPAIDIRHDLDKVSAELGLMAEEQTAAAVRALNRTMPTMRKQSAQGLQDEYPGLKIGTIKARIKIERASKNTPRAALVFSPGRVPLYGNFGMRQVGKWGVKFSRLPWRLETVTGEPVTSAMLARAFRQRARSSGRAFVFSRLGAPRLSFEVLLAPGMARAFAERRIGEVLATRALDVFVSNFEHEAHYRIWKRVQ